MLFTEARFLFFFLVAFSVYWALPRNRPRKVWLLVLSYVFYAAWDWRFLGLILFSTGLDFLVGARIEGAKATRAAQAMVDAQPRRQPRVAGRIQVLQLLRRVGGGVGGPPRLRGLAAHPADHLAGRHQLLHVSDPQLHDRRVSAKAEACRQPARLRRLRRFLSAAGGRADRACLSFPPAARVDAALRGRRAPRLPEPVLDRVHQEGRRLRQHRADHRPGLRRSVSLHRGEQLDLPLPLACPDLLRLLRLLGHGHRHRGAARLPPAAELRLPVLQPEHRGVLAALAHLSVDLVSRLPLHLARR